MTTKTTPIAGTAAGVPFLAVPPAGGPSAPAPTVVAWHLLDAPRTEPAFAAALPLEGLDAWRIYLGLPMCGNRKPAGGYDELLRLGYADAVLNMHGPISQQAAAEFEPALTDLRAQFPLRDGPIGVLGGSIGAAVAQLVITESSVEVGAAVLVSPVVQLRPVVEKLGKRFGVNYDWSEPSIAVADRLDFVARADEIADAGQPAVLLVVGGDDDPDGFHLPAEELQQSLMHRYADPERLDLVVIPRMGHALAEEPGSEPTPQTESAAQVDAHAVRWLRRYLPG